MYGHSLVNLFPLLYTEIVSYLSSYLYQNEIALQNGYIIDISNRVKLL